MSKHKHAAKPHTQAKPTVVEAATQPVPADLLADTKNLVVDAKKVVEDAAQVAKAVLDDVKTDVKQTAASVSAEAKAEFHEAKAEFESAKREGETRLRGVQSRVESTVNQLSDTLTQKLGVKLPNQIKEASKRVEHNVEVRLDRVLDRLGLVRKARVANDAVAASGTVPPAAL